MRRCPRRNDWIAIRWRRNLSRSVGIFGSSCVEKSSSSLESQLAQLEDRPESHKSVYASLLQICKAISIGRRIHSLISRRWLEGDIFLANHLVNMYSRCQSIGEAVQVFEKISRKNVFSWNIMISAYVSNFLFKDALALFQSMDLEGEKPTTVTFIAAVGACSGIGDLKEGRRIHSRALLQVRDFTIVLSTALITMYGKCSSVEDSRRVFEEMPIKNDVSWNAMIGAYAQQGYGHEALELFWKMDLEPNEVTFVSALDACASVKDLVHGKRIHSRVSSSNLSHIVDTALVNMYAKCGSLADARSVFDCMHKEDVVSWTAMIAGYVQHGQAQDALETYRRMEQDGVKPDKIVFISLLDACSCMGDLKLAKLMHEKVLAGGFATITSIAGGLVNMYRKCGSLTGARRVFGSVSRNDLLSWNSLIAGYAEEEDVQEALQILKYMDQEGVKPDGVTFNSILGALSSGRYLLDGKTIHLRCVACGIDVETVGISLVKMYGQCGSLDDAKAVFDVLEHKDVVAWSAFIGAHTKHGHGLAAIELYQGMKAGGVEANDITFIALLDACASTGELSVGSRIHAEIVAAGFDAVAFVATALVNMYGKCGELSIARDVFDRIQPRDVVSWTAMITAYVLHGFYWEALELYFRLEPEGMKADRVTFLSVLEACAGLTALEQGKAVHSSIVSSGLISDTGLNNALINFYGKCGSLDEAKKLFNETRSRDLVTWNSMITSYSHHGHNETSLEMFSQMKLDGVDPNDVTFVSVLFVCSHAGLFEDGCKHFGSISWDHSLELTVDHYGCIIDLLGRAGNLEEAEKLIENLSEPCSVVWMTLLGACRIHGDADRAVHTALRVAELDSDGLAGKVLLSNIYATARDWDEEQQL